MTIYGGEGKRKETPQILRRIKKEIQTKLAESIEDISEEHRATAAMVSRAV